MRIEGIEETVSRKSLKRVQDEISRRIAAIENQIASLEAARAQRDSRINAELASAEQRLIELQNKRMRINTEFAAFPNVVDWVTWASSVASVNFGAQANFDDVIAALQGAGDATFAGFIQQARDFLGGQQVANGTSVERLIDLLEVQRRDAGNSDQQQQRAGELVRALRANLDARNSAARGAARRYLGNQGQTVNPATSDEELVDLLRAIGTQEALELVDRLENSLESDVGQYGLQFAAQVEQFARSMRALGPLLSDVNQRLLDGDYSEADRSMLRNQLVNAAQAFQNGIGIASVDQVRKAVESLARLETATPATLALPITPVDINQTRTRIANALERAKQLLAVWETALPAPDVPSVGDVANWVDRRGVSGNADALDQIRDIDEKISAINATIRTLQTAIPIDSTELQQQLRQVSVGLQRQYANNQKIIENSEERHVQVFEVEEGQGLEIPFRVLDTQNIYDVGLSYGPVNDKSSRVIDQLIYEAEDYADANGNINQNELRILEQQNPDAAVVRRYQINARNGIELVRLDVPFRRSFIDTRLKQAYPGGYYKIVLPRALAHQTATFTVSFTRVDIATTTANPTPVQDPVQSTERQFKVIVYQKERCARTGKRFVHLMNEYGDARWSLQPTAYEKSLFYQRQAIGDVKEPRVGAAQKANQKQIEELRVERRNLVGFLRQYHVQQALKQRDPSPVFFDAKGKQAQIADIDRRLQALGANEVVRMTPEQEREQRLQENWKAAGYQVSFRKYVDQLQARPKSVWVGRCSLNPLPTPALRYRPRRRPSESVSSGFAYPLFAPRRDLEPYSQAELWYMQAGQLVGFRAIPKEFDWAKRAPQRLDDAQSLIQANYRELKVDEFGFDPQDSEYVLYLRKALTQNPPSATTQNPNPFALSRGPFVPVAAKTVGGFETDSESDESDEPLKAPAAVVDGFETDEEEPVTPKAPAPILDGFETDEEELDAPMVQAAAVDDITTVVTETQEWISDLTAFEKDDEAQAAPFVADDTSDYSYYSDDEQTTVVTPDAKGKEEVEAVGDPFADKFSSSSDEAEDEEIVQRLNELEQASNSVRNRWEQITNAELPKLSALRASVEDVKAWVAQLSDHSKKARRASQELISESSSALSELEALSNTLSQ